MLSLEDQLERAKAIADARLGVAEQLSWLIGGLLAWGVNITWGSLWLAAVAGIGAVFLIAHPYKKAADKAWSEFNNCPPPYE